MVEMKQNLVQPSKYGIKCPNAMVPEYVTVHNTANDATATNEVAYMIRNNNTVSFHYAVDDIEIIQGVPTDRNAWHAGDGGGTGNLKSIAIEICYSKSGGDRFVKAEQNAAEFIASILKEKGWGIDRVKKHQDWSGKYCPHRTLDMGWDRFLNMIQSYMAVDVVQQPQYVHSVDEHVLFSTCYPTNNTPMSEAVGATSMARNHGVITSIIGGQNPYCLDNGFCYVNDGDIRGAYIEPVQATPEPVQSIPEVIYMTYVGKWLPEVNGESDYAGIMGKVIQGIKVRLTSGNIHYRVHTVGGDWLPWVDDYCDYAGIIGKNIDLIQMELVGSSHSVEYRVAPIGKDYYPWVRDLSDYAGSTGKAIDRLQIRIV